MTKYQEYTLTCIRCSETGNYLIYEDETLPDSATFICIKCSKLGSLQYQCLRPYIETNLTKEPVEIRSKAQRDELCKQLGVTINGQPSKRDHRKEFVEALDKVSLDQVKQEIRENGPATTGIGREEFDS